MNGKRDLNDYLGKEIQCTCGKVHATNVKRIDIDRGATQRLPGHIKELGYKNLYVVADKNTWKAAGEAAAEELKKAEIPFSALVLDYDELVPDEQVIGEMQAAFPENEITMVDPLSLSVSCHIGPGALAVTATVPLD